MMTKSLNERVKLVKSKKTNKEIIILILWQACKKRGLTGRLYFTL